MKTIALDQALEALQVIHSDLDEGVKMYERKVADSHFDGWPNIRATQRELLDRYALQRASVRVAIGLLEHHIRAEEERAEKEAERKARRRVKK